MISVKSESAAQRLYNHLFQHPEKIESIAHVDFHFDSEDLPNIVEKLLELVITPNIYKLTGAVKSDKFFTTLFQIMDDQLLELKNLVILPYFTGNNNAVLLAQVLRFKDKHESLSLTVNKRENRSELFRQLLSQLDKFKKLNYLKLTGFACGLEDTELVLKRTFRLRGTLEIQDFEYDENNAMKPMMAEQVKRWAAYHVKKLGVLKTLIIETDCRPEFIEYLLYKYPKIERIKIYGKLCFNLGNISVNRALYRIVTAVKNVPYKQIDLVIPTLHDRSSFAVPKLKGGETLGFCVNEYQGQSNWFFTYKSHAKS
ncbi:hypothetical protein [Parasitella parasitica]|uniref:Uncharacterized protein n=1 Tax=Parasitella parasitica TaxID=35722 RepID=A0A0B7N0E1_9FUNG|nr:hypothetical protein [Parasitella parasitica]